MAAKDFPAIFADLKSILKKYESRLVVHADQADTYYLNTATLDKNKKPICFGAASIRKSFVSYYLMPVYAYPDLLEDASADLQARMQGKSCFNFKKQDPALFKELARLTKASFDRYKKEGLL